MSEEFKYIPYSPDDENLRGLIRDGNVYNIKTPVIPGMGETGGYSMSSTESCFLTVMMGQMK